MQFMGYYFGMGMGVSKTSPKMIYFYVLKLSKSTPTLKITKNRQ